MWLKFIKLLIPKTHVLVPKEPSRGHLVSMAIRQNHAFGLSNNMTDEEINKFRKEMPFMAGQYLTNGEKEGSLVTMSQLYEEATGQGFYQLD